jgi:transposase
VNKRQQLLTDEHWQLIEALLPEPKRRQDNRGRPWAANRACFEGILWILQTGAAWHFSQSAHQQSITHFQAVRFEGLLSIVLSKPAD